MKLSKATTETLVDILTSRRTVSFENESDIFPIQGPNAATIGHPLPEPFEVPPPALDRKAIAEILAAGDDSPKGRWIRLVVLSYAVGGRILYRETAPGNFEATVTF